MADENEGSFHSTIETNNIEPEPEKSIEPLTPDTAAAEKSIEPLSPDTAAAEKSKEPLSPDTGAAEKTTEPLPPDTVATAAPAPQFNEHDILAEQFENYLRIAQAFMKTLKRPKDIEICTTLLRKAQRLNDSKHLEVKRNNNRYFRYCLKVLKWTSDNQPLEFYKCWYRNKDTTEVVSESRTWLEDNKSYMALKILKDGTNIIFAAVAENPSAGWQDGGLNILAKRGACLRNG